jgi:hypothetical protein
MPEESADCHSIPAISAVFLRDLSGKENVTSSSTDPDVCAVSAVPDLIGTKMNKLLEIEKIRPLWGEVTSGLFGEVLRRGG